MRSLILTLIFGFILIPSQAYADPKPWYWSWWPRHWQNQDFKPHLDDPKTPHNSQWGAPWEQQHSERWEPQHWVNDAGTSERVIRGFYNAGIIKKQTEYDGVPVLIVGDAFMRLSGQEKRRVAAFIDDTYNITGRAENALFMIYYDRTRRLFRTGDPIGVYDKFGLQLQ